MTVELPALHRNQQRIRDECRRFNVVNCGRRWGKTNLGLDLAAETAIDRGRVGWFAPEYKLLDDAWREIKANLDPIITKKDDGEKYLELVTGGRIEAWSFDRNPNAGRSRKYHRVVIDEAAHCDNLEVVWTKAIRATLTDFKGDAWFLSSPNGKNYFHSLHKRGQAAAGSWKSWTQTSYDNPLLDPAEIDDARTDLPEPIFGQEYLAIFLDDVAQQLVPEHWIDLALEAARPRGHSLRYLAIDISKGTGRDRTVAGVGDDLGLLDLVVSNSIGVGAAADLVESLSVQWGVDHERITYDAGGWAGSDMGRYLEAKGILGAVPYYGSAAGGVRYANRRTRAAWSLRRRLDPDRPRVLRGGYDQPPDSVYPVLAHQRVAPSRPHGEPRSVWAMPAAVLGGHSLEVKRELMELRYSTDKAKVELEHKTNLVDRLGHSPDLADMLIMMAFLWDDP